MMRRRKAMRRTLELRVRFFLFQNSAFCETVSNVAGVRATVARSRNITSVCGNRRARHMENRMPRNYYDQIPVCRLRRSVRGRGASLAYQPGPEPAFFRVALGYAGREPDRSFLHRTCLGLVRPVSGYRPTLAVADRHRIFGRPDHVFQLFGRSRGPVPAGPRCFSHGGHRSACGRIARHDLPRHGRGDSRAFFFALGAVFQCGSRFSISSFAFRRRQRDFVFYRENSPFCEESTSSRRLAGTRVIL